MIDQSQSCYRFITLLVFVLTLDLSVNLAEGFIMMMRLLEWITTKKYYILLLHMFINHT
jgi:hypothetical protein